MKGLWPIAIGIGLAAYLYHKEQKRSQVRPPAAEIAKVMANVRSGSPILMSVAKGAIREWFARGQVPPAESVAAIYSALYEQTPRGTTQWMWQQIAYKVGLNAPSLGTWPTADAAMKGAATSIGSLEFDLW